MLAQQGAQKRASPSTIVPQPGHLDGSTASMTSARGRGRCTPRLLRHSLEPHKAKDMMPPEIFDRSARRLRRARADGRGFFDEEIGQSLLERLSLVSRRFERALLVGAGDSIVTGLRAQVSELLVVDPAEGRGNLRYEEDRPAFPDESFDLIVAAGTLDTVSDLPGALALFRRALEPDGLFLACLFGAPSLPTLRQVALRTDAAEGRAVQRLHPQVDPRSGGDLLTRAGFALPVADTDQLDLSYPTLDRLFADLRESAATNVLLNRVPLTRRWVERARMLFAAEAQDGRTRETVTLLTLTGWAPAESQPKPARRGSGQQSLATVLRPQS